MVAAAEKILNRKCGGRGSLIGATQATEAIEGENFLTGQALTGLDRWGMAFQGISVLSGDAALGVGVAGQLDFSGWFRTAAEDITTADGTANAAQYAKLKDFYRQAEEYGANGIKRLESGRYRFYGTFRPAITRGEMAGARFVREWDPATGATRDWYETIDQAGAVRSVAPKPPMYEQNHFIFDTNGNYVGRR